MLIALLSLSFSLSPFYFFSSVKGQQVVGDDSPPDDDSQVDEWGRGVGEGRTVIFMKSSVLLFCKVHAECKKQLLILLSKHPFCMFFKPFWYFLVAYINTAGISQMTCFDDFNITNVKIKYLLFWEGHLLQHIHITETQFSIENEQQNSSARLRLMLATTIVVASWCQLEQWVRWLGLIPGKVTRCGILLTNLRSTVMWWFGCSVTVFT